MIPVLVFSIVPSKNNYLERDLFDHSVEHGPLDFAFLHGSPSGYLRLLEG
jgi:hypothetical protein